MSVLQRIFGSSPKEKEKSAETQVSTMGKMRIVPLWTTLFLSLSLSPDTDYLGVVLFVPPCCCCCWVGFFGGGVGRAGGFIILQMSKQILHLALLGFKEIPLCCQVLKRWCAWS